MLTIEKKHDLRQDEHNTQRRVKTLDKRALDAARTYAEWKQAALAHDEASGMAQWRETEQSRIYDFATIRARLEQLRGYRAARDDQALVYALEEGIHGNMAGMGKPELYLRSKFGTKRLVTEYIEALSETLEYLADSDGPVGHAEKADLFRRASTCFGRSALLLSGGGIFGNFHAGVVKTLLEQQLLPKIISGSSAGSLIAGIVGTHSSAALQGLFTAQHLQIETRREEQMLANSPSRFFPRFDRGEVARHIDRLIPDLTFAEAFELTGICLNISVSPSEVHQKSRLLNAVTSPHVYVRSAVMASCSVPGVFPPTMLMAKNHRGQPQAYLPGRRWFDGSLSDDIPAQRLGRLYGVNHYIVSQVNPFALIKAQPEAVPFAPASEVLQFWHRSALTAARGWQNIANRYGRRWPDANFAINSLVSVFAQEYRGDINILPPVGMVKPWRGMKRPSEPQLMAIIAAGERATWPKIERIRNCTLIGRTLDRILPRFFGQPQGLRPAVELP